MEPVWAGQVGCMLGASRRGVAWCEGVIGRRGEGVEVVTRREVARQTTQVVLEVSWREQV